MGFIGGVITGVAISAGAAAWYMSRSGQQFRDQHRVEARLGEMGDLLERRTREIQSTVNTQFAEMRATADSTAGETAMRLDDARATAAEEAAASAAAAETSKKSRKSATAAD